MKSLQQTPWLRPAIVGDDFHPPYCYPNYVFSPEWILIGAQCSLYKMKLGERSCLALTSHLCWGDIISEQGNP